VRPVDSADQQLDGLALHQTQQAEQLHQLTHAAGIHLSVRHIPGRLNVIADSLSRREPLNTEWTLHPDVFAAVLRLWPMLQVDVFATRFTNRLPLFVSPFPDERVLAVDGLMFDWTGRDVNAFPPTLRIPQVVKKLEKEQCVVTLVAPLQWSRSWTTRMARRLISLLPLRQDLLIQPACDALRPSLHSLNFHTWRLFGSPSKQGSHSVLEVWKSL
jgi:hypothetical protein